MSTNVSKEKREDLIEKIGHIKSYIEENLQDENTKQLLSYIAEIQKDIRGKKYGLVFEEHKEGTDIVLEENTTVLKEETDLFINNKGKMNFLLEGDNLASLEILTKTHKESIDLIYIDPPYNTGNKDFIYDDDFVDKDDGFKHSKWLSFMEKRLKIASKLLSQDGSIVISIGHQEVHNLVLLCKELFLNKQVACVTIQTSGGKPSGGFNYLHEYLIFITPVDFEPNPVTFAGGKERSPFEGLTLSTFDKSQRPNQVYPIFIDKKTHHIVGTGLSLAERERNGSYTGELSEFDYDYTEAPEGTVALWPISSRGGECVWRLISTRLMNDWNKGYIKVSKNRSKKHPNKYSVQYLPEGVIKKIDSGLLEVVGTEKGAPTLLFGENKTVGSDIPTIWTEKEFYTTKGTTLLKNLLGAKKFPYPKPVELMSEILRATSKPDSIILDFFAGSGTTGHAVMELNKLDDQSQRSFILCTNNQNGICREVTYERLKKASDINAYDMSLKYFKLEHVPIQNKFYYEYADKLLLHTRELVELENAINFAENKEITIILSDEELNEFTNNIEQRKECKVIYLGHDALPSSEQEAMFEKYQIKVNVIPDYYYKELRG
ncbi:site-specific DNA-methyltransferase [Priestia megaterium]|uniref:site-specific DNA-methyltransferase n=1 Tax=Priestia megaterium TaxID=1404 RepID=UPI002A6ACB03|nr:DNA methyltransferase [Priestia megaterium]MDY0943415.1 DNA methyltransferase [Priestia megaterium]